MPSSFFLSHFSRVRQSDIEENPASQVGGIFERHETCRRHNDRTLTLVEQVTPWDLKQAMHITDHHCVTSLRAIAGILLVAMPVSTLADCSAAEPMARYNVVWESPSQDASGQMPLGNGDIAAGVYAIEDGDLYLLLAKNDAFNYNGDIYKTGRVRISLAPNPFAKGRSFRQTLDLPTGSIRIDADGVQLRVWADANRPSITCR